MESLTTHANALVGGVVGLEPVGEAESQARALAWGGYISMMGERSSVRVGISSTEAGCLSLAQAVLGLEEDVMLPKRDVADAVCELMNIIAGKLKHDLAAQAGPLSIGLPVFLAEVPRTVSNLELSIRELRSSGHPVVLLVMRFEHAARTG